MYRGDFKDDERNGQGEMHWTDGTVYSGGWYRGIQHGKGTMKLPDGSMKEGYFQNNIFISDNDGSQISEENPCKSFLSLSPDRSMMKWKTSMKRRISADELRNSSNLSTNNSEQEILPS
jgi:hypothetical protein